MAKQRAVHVVGVGMIPFTKPGASESYNTMGARAAQLALDDAGIQTLVPQKLPKCMGSGGKPGGHANPSGELGNHLAEAGVFTANGLDIGHSQVFKRYDQVGRAEKGRHG